MTFAAYGQFTARDVSEKCTIPGCDRPVRAHGWCGAHYMRWYRHGDPLESATTPGELLRYLNEVVLPYTGNECLLWPYSKDRHGYGKIKTEAVTGQVSRIVCERVKGPPPTPKYEAAHSCGNGHLGCVTAAHLSWKTHRDNLEDRREHGTMLQGSLVGTSRLTESDVREIRRMRGKLSQQKIAAIFGVSQSAVASVMTRKNWSWLDED